MSLVISSEGSPINSSHVHFLGSSTSPTTEKSHSSREVRGVGPAERTGKPSSRYWPGGSLSSCLLRPKKPREKNPSLMLCYLLALSLAIWSLSKLVLADAVDAGTKTNTINRRRRDD